MRVDVSVWDDIDALVGTAIACHGRLDVMVNNAAIASGTGLLDTTSQHWQQVMGVNLTGMFHGCKRAVQQMVTQEPRAEVRGRIINLGSQMGIVNAPHDTPYGVSKAVQLHLARQDRHRAPEPPAGPGDRQRPSADAMASSRPSAGHRERRGVSGERPGHLYDGGEYGHRRRMVVPLNETRVPAGNPGSRPQICLPTVCAVSGRLVHSNPSGNILMSIQRFENDVRYCRVLSHNGTVYIAGMTSDDTSGDVVQQTRDTLAKIEHCLGVAGSDKSKLLTAVIWLRDIADFDRMNGVWDDWIKHE